MGPQSGMSVPECENFGGILCAICWVRLMSWVICLFYAYIWHKCAIGKGYRIFYQTVV
jgi:hypothetical protein